MCSGSANFARLSLLVAALTCGLSGCVSTSGLLLRPGPHKQLESAEAFGHKLPHALNTPRELDKQYLVEYRVEPGDVLVVEPADFNSPVRLPSDQTVLPDGCIELGRYGRLYVADKTVEEIEAEIQPLVDQEHAGDDIVKNASTEISVRLLQPESKTYYVLGDVNSPGSFTLTGRETVLDAIIQAGGLADRANRHRLTLTRPSVPGGCRVVLPICYQQIVQLGDTTTNYQIRPGDRIFVPSLTWFREVAQTLSPSMGENCPKCSGPQMPCPDDGGCVICDGTMAASLSAVPNSPINERRVPPPRTTRRPDPR